MAICTNEGAFFYLLFYFLPRARKPIHRYPEVFLLGILMMELECRRAFAIPADAALAALVINSELSNLPSSFVDCLLEIFGTFGIGSRFSHKRGLKRNRRVHSPLLYR